NRLFVFLFLSILLCGNYLKRAMALFALILLAIVGAKYYIKYQEKSKITDVTYSRNLTISENLDSIAVLSNLIDDLNKRLIMCDSLKRKEGIDAAARQSEINANFERTKREVEIIAITLEQRTGSIQNIIPRIEDDPLKKNRDEKRELQRQVNELESLTTRLRATLQKER